MNERVREIYEAFHGKLIGNFPMKVHVCKTLSLMPDEIIEFVTQNCWFLSSFEEAWAFTFTGADIRDHHLIFLSDELLLQDEHQIHYSIAHEIGHVVLKHRNSITVRQSQEEIDKQEEEADTFAKTYVS